MSPLTSQNLAHMHGRGVADRLKIELQNAGSYDELHRLLSDGLVDAAGVEHHLLRSAATGFAAGLDRMILEQRRA